MSELDDDSDHPGRRFEPNEVLIPGEVDLGFDDDSLNNMGIHPRMGCQYEFRRRRGFDRSRRHKLWMDEGSGQNPSCGDGLDLRMDG